MRPARVCDELLLLVLLLRGKVAYFKAWRKPTTLAIGRVAITDAVVMTRGAKQPMGGTRAEGGRGKKRARRGSHST